MNLMHAIVASTRKGRLLLAMLSGLALLLGSHLPVQAQARVEYNRDVRPILTENCFHCHGPDSASRKAGLRLDQREDAIKLGAISPGKPAESALIERIMTSDPKEIMPPPKAHKKLTAQQKE